MTRDQAIAIRTKQLRGEPVNQDDAEAALLAIQMQQFDPAPAGEKPAKEDRPAEPDLVIPTLKDKRWAREPIEPVDNPWGLTPAQCEVMRLVVAGKETPEISALLHIADKSIYTHLARARERMGNVSLVVAALMWDRFERAEPDNTPPSRVLMRWRGGECEFIPARSVACQ